MVYAIVLQAHLYIVPNACPFCVEHSCGRQLFLSNRNNERNRVDYTLLFINIQLFCFILYSQLEVFGKITEYIYCQVNNKSPLPFLSNIFHKINSKLEEITSGSIFLNVSYNVLAQALLTNILQGHELCCITGHTLLSPYLTTSHLDLQLHSFSNL